MDSVEGVVKSFWFACCLLVSHVEYAPRALLRLQEKPDERTPDRYITLSAIRGQRNKQQKSRQILALVTRDVQWQVRKPTTLVKWIHRAESRRFDRVVSAVNNWYFGGSDVQRVNTAWPSVNPNGAPDNITPVASGANKTLQVRIFTAAESRQSMSVCLFVIRITLKR